MSGKGKSDRTIYDMLCLPSILSVRATGTVLALPAIGSVPPGRLAFVAIYYMRSILVIAHRLHVAVL